MITAIQTAWQTDDTHFQTQKAGTTVRHVAVSVTRVCDPGMTKIE